MGYDKEQMIGIAAFCAALPTIFVGLRVWAKLIRAGLSLDDYLIFPALVRVPAVAGEKLSLTIWQIFCIGGCVCQFIGTIYGRMGQHQPLTPEGMPILDKKFEVFENVRSYLHLLRDMALTNLIVQICAPAGLNSRPRIHQSIDSRALQKPFPDQ
jgi:hypothetical protein